MPRRILGKYRMARLGVSFPIAVIFLRVVNRCFFIPGAQKDLLKAESDIGLKARDDNEEDFSASRVDNVSITNAGFQGDMPDLAQADLMK